MYYSIIFLFASLLAIGGCGNSSSATLDGGPDSGTDGDSDTDSDSDSDSDADSDTDSDSDADSDADSDSDSDSDADSDADSDSDSDADTPCTISVGPPTDTIDISGTCQDAPEDCEGGYEMMNQAGTCDSSQTCCVDTDQCESAMGATCAASSDDCEGDPPMGDEFPQMGCPPSTPFCCVGAGGGPTFN